MHIHIKFKKFFQNNNNKNQPLWRRAAYGGKGSFDLCFQTTAHHWRSQNRSSSRGWSRDHEEMLSAGLACLASFCIHLRTTCPGNGVTHSGLEPPISTNNRDNPSGTCPRSVWSGWSLNWDSPQETLGCVKWTVKGTCQLPWSPLLLLLSSPQGCWVSVIMAGLSVAVIKHQCWDPADPRLFQQF